MKESEGGRMRRELLAYRMYQIIKPPSATRVDKARRRAPRCQRITGSA